MANQYDLTLASIPLAFTIALAVAVVSGREPRETLVVASAFAIVVLVDACYLRPPVDAGSR